MVPQGEQRERGRRQRHELSPGCMKALKGVMQPGSRQQRGWDREGPVLLGGRWKGLDFSALRCQGASMQRLGCCSVRAERSPACQLRTATGSWLRGPYGLGLQGSPGMPLGGGRPAAPSCGAEEARQEGVEERGRGKSRRQGWPGLWGGVCLRLKAQALLKSNPGYPGSKAPDAGALRPVTPRKFYLSNQSKRG